MNIMKYRISSIKYILIFIPFVFVVNNAIIIEKFIKWFSDKGILDTTGLIAYMIVGLFLSIALFTILAHKYIIKGFSIFILICSTAATYFISKYDIAVDRSMILNVWYTDSTETLSLLSSDMALHILFLTVIPAIIIIRTKIIFDRPVKHSLKLIATFAIAIIIALAAVYLKFNSIHKAGNKSNKYIAYQIVPVNFLIGMGSAVKHYIKRNYKFDSAPVKIEGKVLSKDDLIVVLAIGEAARQKSLSLYGYKRDTNPLLSQKDDIFTLNGIAKYGSTIYALPNILSRDDIKLPSITSALGIPTSCYSNFKLYGNCGTVKEVMVSNCGHGGKCYDEDVIPLLKKDLESYTSGQKMVVLHIGAGSHGPVYGDRFPPEFQYYKPRCTDPDVINNCTKEELYNSYDNSIRYMDYVVSNLIDTLEEIKKPYVFIYLSDHGESLLEEGRIFHGMPPGVDLPAEQAQVPLLIKSSMPIGIKKQEEYKQQAIYDTILDLLSIETDLLRKDKVFIKKDTN
ncbi:MAG: hypothetical protein DRG78_06005 [Epsilonproteobacteria bacterium]|nr:MAG: hypothetical protein DRG78_06005 [Campylobacterota bacterium]